MINIKTTQKFTQRMHADNMLEGTVYLNENKFFICSLVRQKKCKSVASGLKNTDQRSGQPFDFFFQTGHTYLQLAERESY